MYTRTRTRDHHNHDPDPSHRTSPTAFLLAPLSALVFRAPPLSRKRPRLLHALEACTFSTAPTVALLRIAAN